MSHELKTETSAEDPSCAWTQDGEDSDIWAAACGGYFTLNEGTPEDNRLKFCCYCGKQLTQVAYETEDDEQKA